MTSFSHVQPPYPWFQAPWQHFIGQYQAQRLPHALLLKGVSGIGADKLAVCMAYFLLCKSPAEAQSCGVCRSCQLIQARFHPDLFELKPEEGSSVIKIGQVRALGDFIAATAQQGGRKLVVINPAEAMNVEASNALLKNLEEPSGDTQIILVTHQVARVLPTIRSRTFQLSLKSPDRNTSLEWLKRNRVTDAETYLNAANGAPVKAMQWLEENKLAAHNDIASMLLNVFEHQVSVVDTAAKLNAHDLLFALNLVQQWLEQAVKYQLLPNKQQSLDELVGHPLVAKMASFAAQRLFHWLDAVQSRLDQLYRGSNPNKQLAYEDLLLVMTSAKPSLVPVV